MGYRKWAFVAVMGVSAALLASCFLPTVPPPSPVPTHPTRGVPSAVRVRTSPPVREPAQPSPEYGVHQWKPDVSERDWKHIVIHHTATSRGSVESIHETHLQRTDADGNSWMGIGYHFVIGNGNGMPDGRIEPTFRWRGQMQGAHAGVAEYNEHGIGIALVGDFEKGPPTPRQLASVKRLVSVLKSEYGIASDEVLGHREIKATACPGEHFPLAEIGEALPEVWYGRRTRKNSAAVQVARN